MHLLKQIPLRPCAASCSPHGGGAAVSANENGVCPEPIGVSLET